MKKLSIDFFKRQDVVTIARQLLGKILVTNIKGIITSGRIVETEAYVAFTDKASHAYKGKRTPRNESMYAEGGVAYVYTCYGIHQLFNVVTNVKDVPDAVLIRALEPIKGINEMLRRLNKTKLDKSITKGPGNLCRAMRIGKLHSGIALEGQTIYIAEDQYPLREEDIIASKRIGIESAGEDALLPYRFFIRGNPYVSANKKLSG